jgi:hypothetical protein
VSLDESVKIRVCQIKFSMELACQNFPEFDFGWVESLKTPWMKVTLSSKVSCLKDWALVI